MRRPPASLECAAAAGPLRSSAQRFTGAPLPWPPAPGGSGQLPAQLSSSAKSHRTPLSHVPAGLEQHVQEGKLRNKKPQLPGRHSHAQFTWDMVWGAVTPRGSSCLGVPLLLQQNQHGHSVGWEDWQEQQHPSFYSPHTTSKAFYMHKTSSAFIPGLWQSLSPNPTGRGMEQHLVMGLGGGKETPVLWGALLGQGDEPWHGARVPPRTGPPSSPCIRAKVTSPKAFPFLQP